MSMKARSFGSYEQCVYLSFPDSIGSILLHTNYRSRRKENYRLREYDTNRISWCFDYIFKVEFFVEDLHFQQVVVDHTVIVEIEV